MALLLLQGVNKILYWNLFYLSFTKKVHVPVANVNGKWINIQHIFGWIDGWMVCLIHIVELLILITIIESMLGNESLSLFFKDMLSNKFHFCHIKLKNLVSPGLTISMEHFGQSPTSCHVILEKSGFHLVILPPWLYLWTVSAVI